MLKTSDEASCLISFQLVVLSNIQGYYIFLIPLWQYHQDEGHENWVYQVLQGIKER